MTEKQTLDLASIVDALTEKGGPPDSEGLSQVAKALAKQFGVDPDEVAILGINPKDKSLRFVIPVKLATVGSIPLSSATALASRTARDRRPELVNNFSTARHASVFEGVPLGRHPAEMIHKIMSAPIVDGTHVRGVVQISKKGRTSAEAGLDFTQTDLRALTSLCATLERFLKLCKPA